LTVHRMGRWTPEEDRRLLEMVARGKSWLLVAANLKRPKGSVRTRAYVLKRKASVRSSEDTEPASTVEDSAIDLISTSKRADVPRKHKRRPRRICLRGLLYMAGTNSGCCA
jgi:hypothetical protein